MEDRHNICIQRRESKFRENFAYKFIVQEVNMTEDNHIHKSHCYYAAIVFVLMRGLTTARFFSENNHSVSSTNWIYFIKVCRPIAIGNGIYQREFGLITRRHQETVFRKSYMDIIIPAIHTQAELLYNEYLHLKGKVDHHYIIMRGEL